MYKHMRKALTALLALLLALSAPALAESLTASVEKTAGKGENTFTVLDYTFDGRDLRVLWEAETAGDEALLFTTGMLDNDVGPLITPRNDVMGLTPDVFIPLGGEDAAHFAGCAVAGFEGVTPSRDFNATLTGYFVRPLVEVIDVSDALNGSLEPGVEHTGAMLVHFNGRIQPLSSIRIDAGEDGALSFQGRNSLIDADTYYENPHKSMVELYADIGLFEIVDVCEVSFPVRLPVGETVALRAAELPVVETKYYDIAFTQAEVGLSGLQLAWEVRSKTGRAMDEDWVGALDVSCRVAGEALDFKAYRIRREYTHGVDGEECLLYSLSQYGNPVLQPGDAPLTVEVEYLPPEGASVPEDAEFPTVALRLEPVALEP